VKQILTLAIVSKLITFLIIFLAASILPYSKNLYEPNFLYPPHAKHTLLSAFSGWDSQHYMYLISQGYHPHQLSNAFFPLFPLLGMFLNTILHNPFLSGMFVANIASLVGLVFFYKFLQESFPKIDAYLVVVLFLTFPTAFYLSLIYSEALFLCLLFLFFYFLYRKNYGKAGIVSFFIPLARPMGTFVFVPFLLFYFLDRSKKQKEYHLPSFSQPVVIKGNAALLNLGFPILGVLVYFLFMQVTTGNLFDGFVQQNRFVLGLGLPNLLAPFMIVHNFFIPHLSVHSFQTSALDRAFFVFFLCMVPLMYKLLDKTLFSYATLMGITPFLGTFMAFPRYMLPIFPIAMVLSLVFQQEKYRFLLLPYLLLSFALQIFFTVLYALNYWVA
jgi:hypothetical protein